MFQARPGSQIGGNINSGTSELLNHFVSTFWNSVGTTPPNWGGWKLM